MGSRSVRGFMWEFEDCWELALRAALNYEPMKPALPPRLHGVKRPILKNDRTIFIFRRPACEQ
jgi:hypothetical protein